MKRGTPEHPKMLMLMSILGLEKYAAVGIMETLWLFAARYAPQGDIGKYTNDAIGKVIGWTSDPDALIEALLRSGFLEPSPEYRLIIHDWSEHSDNSADRYLSDHQLLYADGNMPRTMARQDVSWQATANHGKPRQAKTRHGKPRQTMASNVSAPIPIPIPIPIPTPTPGTASVEATPTEEEGDEAHRILKARPELHNLTWEQDLAGRKCVMGLEMYGGQKLDFIAAARWIAAEAVAYGAIDAPGCWLRRKYQGYFEKKDAPAGKDPMKRRFIGEQKNAKASV